jgi:hypothetical protein
MVADEQGPPRRANAPADVVREDQGGQPTCHDADVPEESKGGAEGIRTPDPLIANEVRYQLRHSPW